MRDEHQIRAELVALIRDGFKRPSHITADDAALVYLTEVAGTLMAMHPTDFEWEHVRAEFLRSWTKPTWPLPSEFPRRLGAFRQRQAKASRAADWVTRRAEADARRPPYHHGEYLAAVNRASFMASSPDRAEAAWGRRLLDIAKTLNEKRDDTDQPRDPRRRELEAAE